MYTAGASTASDAAGIGGGGDTWNVNVTATQPPLIAAAIAEELDRVAWRLKVGARVVS